jgi:hypothetical protein
LPRLTGIVDFLGVVFFFGAFDLTFFLVLMPILSTMAPSESLSSLSLILILLSSSLSSSLLCTAHVLDFLDFLLEIDLLDFLGTGITINRYF